MVRLKRESIMRKSRHASPRRSVRLSTVILALAIFLFGTSWSFAADDIDVSADTALFSELNGNYGLIVPDDVRIRFQQLDREEPPLLLNPAEYFDWRETGMVTPVKNQGGCGSCWDFAATGAFESAVAISNGYHWDLSEQQVIDCNAEGYGCGGGWMSSVYDLFMSFGAVEEPCYPYFGQDGRRCAQDSCVVIAVQDGYEDVQNTVNAIKNALTISPLSTTLSIPEGFHWDCFDGQWANADHAVVIVGWDDGLCGNRGGWIVKNSWGEGWGDEGFFYIPYNSCGIGHYTQLPIFAGGIAKIARDRDHLIFNVPSGGIASETLNISNIGREDLYYRLRASSVQDSYGYYWTDSEKPLGPQYNWIDITEIGEPIDFPGYPGYSNTGPIDLGFDFSFYGNTFSSINVCSEGWLSFTDDESRTPYNLPIPSPNPPNNLLAVFWENLNPTDENVFFYTNNLDTAIVSYVNVEDIYHRGEFTFQAILLGDGAIVYQYLSMGPEGPVDQATIGIENGDGTIGLQVCCDRLFTYGQRAVRFDLGQPPGEFDWFAFESDHGMLTPTQSAELEFTCYAGERVDGTFWANLELYSNDHENTVIEFPIIMNVGATSVDNGRESAMPGDLEVFSCYPNPFNASAAIEYRLGSNQYVTVEIFDLLGRRVEMLSNDNQSAGIHRAVWNAEESGSGVYFYRIAAGKLVQSGRMVLLK